SAVGMQVVHSFAVGHALLRTRRRGSWYRALGTVMLACAGVLLVLLLPVGPQAATTLPSGFQETTAFSGLTNPTTFRFAPDGRVFVAEKSGVIKVFANLQATSPT